MNNSEVLEYLEFIYPRKLEIKQRSEMITSSKYLDLYFYIGNEKLSTRLYDKRYDFNFPIVIFSVSEQQYPLSTWCLRFTVNPLC